MSAFSFLVAPRVAPPLDARFRPAVLANLAYRDAVRGVAGRLPVRLALEQADGSVFHFATEVLPADHSHAASNRFYLERTLKLLLWSRGGFRVHFDGPSALAADLASHYRSSKTGQFDSQIIGERIYDHAIEIVPTKQLPSERSTTAPLGRHLGGCRIGFDLGGSDRKVAAVIDGKVVFSEESVWDPYPQADPQYHYDGITDSLAKAAAHLPRVDAVGGSAAGVYVNNRVKVASLFRAVPQVVFDRRVKNMFLDLQRAWRNVPFEVVNDGEVTALAGSMALGENAVLGIALGTSTAGGYVSPDGTITTWLNEFAFLPFDYHPEAPVDEWSGDHGCGVQYFSQQCVGRLLAPAGIAIDGELALPEKLKRVQELMERGDERAHKIYETIGVYLGYGLAHLAGFYDFKHVLVLGRVTSGPGGDVMLARTKDVLRTEFPELARAINFHSPDEKEKRHGQAIAAASLPALSDTGGVR
jgi:predicted NBD/HSP70 family sugar kinase